jgi:hypothetical protein
VATICLSLELASVAHAQTGVSVTSRVKQETAVTTVVSGPFDVKLAPLATANPGEGASLGRMSIDKRFHGDLDATSKGEMLTGMSDVKGSAGYVAMERVTGTLNGRRGTFILQHSATMTRGAPQLIITVVPDSGTGELTGLTGTMAIRFGAAGEHFYDFDYTLPHAP